MIGSLKRVIGRVEPYYDWGARTTFRMDAKREEDVTEGEVRFFELQWLGLHFEVQVGRTPPRAEDAI
jgi:hypothetical protein